MRPSFKDEIDRISKMRNSGNPEGALEGLKELWRNFLKANPSEAYEVKTGIPIPINIRKNFATMTDAKGRCYQAMKNFSEARKCFKTALDERREIWLGIPNDVKAEIAYAYSAFQLPIFESIAKTLPRGEIVKLFKLAEPIIQNVIDKSDDIDVSDLGNMYQNLAFISQFKGDFNEAISLYFHVLPYREQAKDKRGKALTYARIGECSAELGEQDAIRYLNDAMDIFENMGDTVRIQQIEDIKKKFNL